MDAVAASVYGEREDRRWGPDSNRETTTAIVSRLSLTRSETPMNTGRPVSSKRTLGQQCLIECLNGTRCGRPRIGNSLVCRRSGWRDPDSNRGHHDFQGAGVRARQAQRACKSDCFRSHDSVTMSSVPLGCAQVWDSAGASKSQSIRPHGALVTPRASTRRRSAPPTSGDHVRHPVRAKMVRLPRACATLGPRRGEPPLVRPTRLGEAAAPTVEL
jgi:hypothetical protein